jgi:hypothetical protein
METELFLSNIILIHSNIQSGKGGGEGGGIGVGGGVGVGGGGEGGGVGGIVPIKVTTSRAACSVPE